MTSSSDLKNHHISILHYWNRGIRSAPVIHRKTNIPLRTIYYNINKLKQTNSLKHRGGNGRPHVLSGILKNAISQYIRRNNEITVKEIKQNLSTAYHLSVSIPTIRQQKRKPKNIDELELFLAEEFKNTDINVVVNCMMSMKKDVYLLVRLKVNE